MPRYSDKFSKYLVLRKASAVTPYLPETRRMSGKAFRAMMEKYGSVIVKPTNKFGGYGVIKVSRSISGEYKVHMGKKVSTQTGSLKLERYIMRKAGKGYLVQRLIPLATVRGRPFDLRVMVQRRRSGDWLVTGKLVKLAGKGYIVTNTARSQGTVHSLEYAIARSSLKHEVSAPILHRRIDEVALHVARQIRKSYPRQRILGIDMGLDGRGGIWIIEVNFYPALSLFLKLKDKSMYRKIVSYRR